MLHLMLLFGHLLATSTALGAIVATDLRMLSKLSRGRVRIPPPNPFVARLVMIALVLLYATGGAMLYLGSRDQVDYLTPKLQGKLLLVALLTFNALVLHRVTFPRLRLGRSLNQWDVRDWLMIVVPVALSNSLWMFCAFLGIARPWNHTMAIRDILEIAVGLYLFALIGVTLVLAAAARERPADKPDDLIALLTRFLASVGHLGKRGHRHGAGEPKARKSRHRTPATGAQIPVLAVPGPWPDNPPRPQA